MMELYSKHVKLKWLVNNTTHCRCSPGKGKTTKWKRMIGQRDGDNGTKNQGSSSKNRLIKMTITRGNVGMVSFFIQAWNMGKYALGYLKMVSFFTSFKHEKYYAWIWLHFYTNLKQRQTMLEITFIFTQSWNKEKLCLRQVCMPPT